MKSSNTEGAWTKGAPNGGTETITEKYALMKKTAGKIVLALPILTTAAAVSIPNVTAAAEADHARLRRPEPPGIGRQAQGKELRPHQRRLQGPENLRRQIADGMPQMRHKPQVRGLPRVRMPAIKEEVMPCSSDKERALTVLGKWNTGIFHTGQKASNQKKYL